MNDPVERLRGKVLKRLAASEQIPILRAAAENALANPPPPPTASTNPPPGRDITAASDAVCYGDGGEKQDIFLTHSLLSLSFVV